MALNISLHPLVIINISDHYTRQVVRFPNKLKRVFGALLGIQTGRTIEVFHSFELVYNDEQKAIDTAYFAEKENQMKTVFPKYDVLGWYSTGHEVLPIDLELNKQILQFNESPLFLLLDPAPSAASRGKDLPISIFETELKIVKDVPQFFFTKIAFKIETMQAERIAVDHIAHVSSSGAEGSALISHMNGMYNAINMLHLRIKTILEFIQATKKGTIPVDHSLLRKIASMTQLLPCMDSPAFQENFLREYNDTLLVTYLATITKGTNTLNELIDKFSTAQDRHRSRGHGGGMGGMMGMGMSYGGMGMFP